MLNKNKKITLITETASQDADGFSVVSETTKSIWAAIDTVSGEEFYQTGLLNIRPSFRAIVWSAEYNNAEIVVVDGKRYGIYRTYLRNTDEIELYLQEKVGVD